MNRSRLPSWLPRRQFAAALVLLLVAPVLTVGVVALSGGGRDTGPDEAQARAATSFDPTPIPTPEPTPPPPTPNPTPPPPPEPFLARRRIVSFYGNPLSPILGILGEFEPPEMIRRLRAQAAVYQDLSPDREVVPALHLIYAVAQASAGSDGLYLWRMDEASVRRWIDIARENNLLLFLDIQFGRSTVDREIPLVLPYLDEPFVQVSLDPEFRWRGNEGPSVLGRLDAAEINRAQELVSQYLVERNLPSKVLIVHQFRYDMITNKDKIASYDRVELVFDMDGFGPPQTKLETWNAVIKNDGVARAGIKLFYKHDIPLMREADVIGLEPVPLVIIYQ